MEKLFSTGEVARMLGIQRDDLNSALRSQVVSYPAHKTGRWWAWTLEEIEVARRAITDNERMRTAPQF